MALPSRPWGPWSGCLSEPTAVAVGVAASLAVARLERGISGSGAPAGLASGVRGSVFYLLQFPASFGLAAVFWRRDWSETPKLAQVFGFFQAGLWAADMFTSPSLAHLLDTGEDSRGAEGKGVASTGGGNGSVELSGARLSIWTRLKNSLFDASPDQWLDRGLLVHHLLVFGVTLEVLWKRKFMLFYQYWVTGYGGLFDFLGNLKPVVALVDKASKDGEGGVGLKEDECVNGAAPVGAPGQEDLSPAARGTLVAGRWLLPSVFRRWYPQLLRASFLWLRVVQPQVQYWSYRREIGELMGFHILTVLNVGVIGTVFAMGLDKCF